MQEQTIFEILHNMDTFTNSLIIKWNKIFKEKLSEYHEVTLGYVNTNGKQRPSQIDKKLGLTPPTFTHLTDKLVNLNLATRLPDQNDHCIILLDITDKGKEVLDRANQKGHELR